MRGGISVMVLAGRSRLMVLAALLGGVALLATLVLATRPMKSGPRLDAPGTHYSVSAAATANGPIEVAKGVFMGADQHHDRSSELRTIKAIPPRGIPLDEEDQDGGARAARGSTAPAAPVQSALASPAMPATGLNFDGIPFPGVVCNCAPPDTNGEVGATQYVQIVNEGFQVFDKSTGASQYGPAAISTIWSGAGNLCATAGHGDPIVLYDQLNGRWVISQFAGSTPTDECIAVSTTSDALGAWNRYDFHLSSNFMDYPHGAVWTDGYYFSFNVFNSSGTAWLGPQPIVFDGAAMRAGTTATFQTPGVQSSLPTYNETFLPADLDGSTPPPANAPATYVSFPDNGTYSTYHYKVSWTAPGSSTWTQFAAPVAGGFSLACSGNRTCVPQGGAGSTNLDGLADRLMFRLAYRNFGDHESVVGNYTVASGGVTGIRWFELRNVTAGPVTIYQESTYQPDSTWRWMGSAAMDHNGDMAIGFSASSSSIVPGLRYAGRLVGDPLNTLAQGEATLFAGVGSQSGTGSRWGDYSDLTVDPVDDCTFWFTSEYYPAGVSQFNWRTRIGSFTFPGCGGSPTTGSISGTVIDSSTSLAISGATVAVSGGPSTTTNASGAYTLSGLTGGSSYSVTASKTGYLSQNAPSVPVTAGGTTTQNFSLAPNPVHTTAFTFPSAAPGAGTGGDGDGYQVAPAGWWTAFDGNVATDSGSGTASSQSCTSAARDSEVAASFSMGSLGTSILGIQVQLRGRANSSSSSPKFCVQVSNDGGASWSTGKVTAALKTSLTTYTLGTTSDLWGFSWSSSTFSSSFRVRIIDLANSTSKTFSLDGVSVAVTYQ